MDQLVKLNANENSYGTHPQVLEAMQRVDHSLYPDPAQIELRTALARLHGVSIANVVAGAGCDDILDILVRMVGPQTIIISTPTFGMYAFLGKIANAKVVDVPRRTDFSVDVAGVVAAIRAHNSTLVFLPSPNNPTGTVLPNEDILTLLQEQCILVVDEAYTDFCDTSAEPLLAAHPNLVIGRTFSKWAGLAGLRLGYCVAHEKLVNIMLAIKQPYNVNTAAEAAGCAALAHRDEIMLSVAKLREAKDKLYISLAELPWLRPLPSEANFVLCEVLGISAVDVYEGLRRQGIIIRYFGSQGGQLQNYIRISAGKPEQMARCVVALMAVGRDLLQNSLPITLLNPKLEALLFDMDGVLADVTHSQHRAILDTAHHFGVCITRDDIVRIKAKGNANNDWIATTTLIHEAGNTTVTLAQVTEQFELLYQGTESTPGLWAVETLLPTRVLLQRLAANFPMAIVTGRPRPDAERFLDQHNIREFFRFMVCMNETASKPSPEPVHLAMRQLGVQRAILIGDTPDDVMAAVAAGRLTKK